MVLKREVDLRLFQTIIVDTQAAASAGPQVNTILVDIEAKRTSKQRYPLPIPAKTNFPGST